ncbi:MAG TPA: DUF11 domain-containing protein, partial [Phnomibacter sp.]|nr:DUF11 domain-containing protein [Phnomibacter sp.]
NEGCGSADLRITKAVDNTTPLVGTQVTFTIVVTNGGPDPATGVVVNDALPSGYTYVGHTASTGTYTPATGVWNIGNLAVNASVTLTITATVRGTGNYTNTATVRGNEVDPNLNNNTATAATNPIRVADLRVVKTVNNATPQIGGEVVFTIQVTNLGPSPATGVTVTDLLPTGYTYVSHTTNTGTFNPATGVWTIGNLSVGGSVALTITARVNATGEYANTATVRGNENDPVLQNNSSTVTVNPRQPDPSDLIITKSGSTEAAPGGQIMYTITVRNQGAGPAANVVITDPIPQFLNNAEYSLNGTTNWMPWTGSYTVGTLQPGQSFTLYIRAAIDREACDEIANTASVTTSSVDNNPNNNSSTVKTKMAVGDDTFKVIANWGFKNNQGGYPVVADNAIPGITAVITSSEPYNYTASGVATGQLAFEYSGNSGAIYMQPSTGENQRYWTLELSGPNLYVFNQFSWYFQAQRLPKGATRINYAYSKDGVNFVNNGGVDLVQQNKWEEIRTDWSALGDLNGQDLDKLYIRLYAAGSDSRLVSDATRLELSNFQLRAFAQRRDIVCEGDPDLTIAKSAVNEAAPGSTITYRITVRNQGDGPAKEVVVEDELPQFLSNAEYSLNGNTGWQPWTGSYPVGELQPNQTFTLFIRATIDADACGEIINTANVTTGSDDVNPDNNSTWVKTKIAVGTNGTQVLANFKFLNSPTGYPIVADNLLPGINAIITSSEAFNYTASGVATGQLAFEFSGNSGAIYMQPSSGENQRYWQLELSGPNLYIFSQFSMYLQSERLPQGARRMNFAYSTDGVNYVFNGGIDLPQQNQWYEVVADWTQVPALNTENLTKVYIRLYAAGSDARGVSDATRLELSNLQIRGFSRRREIDCVRDIAGIVLNDGNCLTDNSVNGTPTNAGGTLWVNLLDGTDKVVETSKVADNGTYRFEKVGEQAYTLQLSTTAGVVGQPAPATLLPENYVHTGEHIGAGAGNDGNADGMLAVPASKANVSQANFGIQQLPVTNAVLLDIMDPLTNGQVLTLDKEPHILNGQDAEDGPGMGSMNKGSTFRITTVPDPADGILRYNGQTVTAGQVIVNYDPALLAFVAARDFEYGQRTCFSYALADGCGLFDPSPASFCIQSAVIVPVTGLVLTVQRIPGTRDADLIWTSRSENNTSHYIVERSANGTNFAPVSGNLPAA